MTWPIPVCPNSSGWDQAVETPRVNEAVIRNAFLKVEIGRFIEALLI
jgi:hypothetical protein